MWTPKTGATTRSAGAAQTLWMAPVKKRTCEILWWLWTWLKYGWHMMETCCNTGGFWQECSGVLLPSANDVKIWHNHCILLVRCPLCLSECIVSQCSGPTRRTTPPLRLEDATQIWKLPASNSAFSDNSDTMLLWEQRVLQHLHLQKICTTFEFRGPHDWYQPHSGEGGFYCALAEYDDSFHWFHAPTSTGSCPASSEQKEITLVQTSFIRMFVSVVSFRLRWGSGHESSGCRAALDGPFPLESCKARLGSTHCGDVKLPASDATL
jgi:hypothetical protein